MFFFTFVVFVFFVCGFCFVAGFVVRFISCVILCLFLVSTCVWLVVCFPFPLFGRLVPCLFFSCSVAVFFSCVVFPRACGFRGCFLRCFFHFPGISLFRFLCSFPVRPSPCIWCVVLFLPAFR